MLWHLIQMSYACSGTYSLRSADAPYFRFMGTQYAENSSTAKQRTAGDQCSVHEPADARSLLSAQQHKLRALVTDACMPNIFRHPAVSPAVWCLRCPASGKDPGRHPASGQNHTSEDRKALFPRSSNRILSQ